MPKKKMPTPLGQNIRTAREMAGITQLDFAHKIGFKGKEAGSYISRIEAGQHMPRIDTLGKMAKALGVELSSLLDGPAPLPAA